MIKTIIITTPSFFPKEVYYCNQLFDHGLEILHVRKPEATKEELYHFLTQIDEPYRNRIVLHNHYSLIDELHLRGVHLTAKTKDTFQFPDTYQHVSMSCHSFSEIDALKTSLNYCFLSPIFDSISKQGYTGNFTLTALQSYLKTTTQPVYALGGISDKNISKVIKIGFKGVALLGYIWGNPQKAVHQLKNIQHQIKMNNNS